MGDICKLSEFGLCNNPVIDKRKGGTPKQYCSPPCKAKYESLKKRQPKQEEPELPADRITDYLARGRTYSEISKRFRLTREQIDELLARDYPGYELYRTRNNFMDEVFVLLPEVHGDEIKVEPRVWTYRRQPDGEPFLWVQFPASLDFSKILVIDLADIHKGSMGHDDELWREYLNWIAITPNVFVLVGGDVLELAYGESVKGKAVMQQNLLPRDQQKQMAKDLSIIAHKILVAIPGNHENRAEKYDFDPLEWICERLGIPYFNEPVHLDILWKGYVFTFFMQHGTSSSKTKGGKMNAAADPLKWQGPVMFTIYNHVHDATVERVDCIIRDRVNFRLRFMKRYVCIGASFLKYFGTYAAKRGLPPGSRGTVSCKLYPNGDYHASM